MNNYNLNLSAIVITYNEEVNIKRVLDSIIWVPQVVVIDSGSTDHTIRIIESYSNVQVFFRKFDTFANQCNYGLTCITSEWVLSLDADYVISRDLRDEIIHLFNPQASNISMKDAYQIGFRYCINGKAIRSGILPPRISLYRKSKAVYYDEGHGHRVKIDGTIGTIDGLIYHDDRKSLTIWLNNQMRYQLLEADLLLHTASAKLPKQDILRKHTCFAPFAALIYTLIFKGGLLDGKEGIIYAFQRMVAETILYLCMHNNFTTRK
jgi:glycosyltransferase involved in cell wall biosynthesis